MTGLWSLWQRFWFEPISASSISMFRIFFGLVSLLNALLYLPDFLIWFGADGVAPLASMAQYHQGVTSDALLWLNAGDGFYLALLWTEIATSLLAMLGFLSKPSLVTLWLVRLVLYWRNPVYWHQVDIMLRIWGTLLLFCPAGEMYSIDSWLRRRADPDAPRRLFAPWGQRLIQIKLSLIYAEAFLGKIVAPHWQEGTAVYYATHFPDGGRYAIPAFLDHILMYRMMNYFTLVIEFSLMLLIWLQPVRYAVLFVGLIFHLGIHAFINLDLLEFGVVIAFLAFIDPEDMEAFLAWIGFGGARRARLEAEANE